MKPREEYSKVKTESGLVVNYFVKNVEQNSVVAAMLDEMNFKYLCFGSYGIVCRSNDEINNVRTPLLPYLRGEKNQNEK